MDKNGLKKELEDYLRSVYDDDDFVFGTIVCAGNARNWQTMLDYVAKAEELGEEVSHDDLVALSLVLKKRDGRSADGRREK